MDERESLGTARGVLDLLSLQGRHEACLIDRGSLSAVSCTFPEDMHDQVIALVGHEVIARGRLFRNSAGQKIHLEMWSLERVDRGVPVPINELIGVLGSDWTGGESSVDFVRARRDAPEAVGTLEPRRR